MFSVWWAAEWERLVAYFGYNSAVLIVSVGLTALGFVMLFRSGLYPPEIPSVNLDFDWLYRKAAPRLGRATLSAIRHGSDNMVRPLTSAAAALFTRTQLLLKPGQRLADDWSTSTMLIIVLLLALAGMGLGRLGG